MTDILNAALQYAVTGWPVFPLRGKKPLTEHGVKDATTDPDIIEEWWQRWPDANVGIACGSKSADVIDIDSAQGEAAMVEWLQARDIFDDAKAVLNSTPISLTSKGKHVLFQPAGRLKNLVRAAEGVDVRTDGGYIVAPPSVHPDSGKVYEWAPGRSPDEIALAPFPDWMIEYLSTGKNSPSKSLFSKDVIKVREGERNAALFRQAASARSRGLGGTAIMAMLNGINSDQCDPPLPPQEVERIAQSVVSYPPGGAKDAIGEPVNEEDASIIDFCHETEDKDGNPQFKFSPTKSSVTIPEKYFNLKMAENDPAIYRYDGQIYKPDGVRQIDRLICTTVEDKARERDITEVVRRVKNELLETPVEFDHDPYLLGLRNGVADLRTGEVREYRPDDLITDQIDVAYNPAAKCPTFLKFLTEIAPHPADRLTLVDWIPATAIKKPLPYALFMLGLGRNGKGTYEDLVMDFFGSESFRQMPLSTIQKSDFAPSYFHKKRGWIASEQSGKKKATIGTDFMKLVSGAGVIDSDRKNKDRIQFRPYFQTIVDTNAMPLIEDTSVGWQERFCKTDLPYTFVPNPDPTDPLQKLKDPHLLAKLTTDEEKSGILNLLLWRSPEISETGAICKRPAADMYAEYAQQSASVSTFCEAFCEYDEFAVSVRIPTNIIYDAYKEWCRYLVGEVVDPSYFGRYLKRFCDDRLPARPKIDGKNVTVYPGLIFHADRVTSTIESIATSFSPNLKQSQANLRQNDEENGLLVANSHASQAKWKLILSMFGEKSSVENVTLKMPEMPEMPENSASSDLSKVAPAYDLDETVPETLDQMISEFARKGQSVLVSDLIRTGRSELEVLDALDSAGWTEGKRGWWSPPRRST